MPTSRFKSNRRPPDPLHTRTWRVRSAVGVDGGSVGHSRVPPRPRRRTPRLPDAHLQTLPTQSCPCMQSCFEVHWGFASTVLRHTLSAPQTGMRPSMRRHSSLVSQRNLQKPSTHARGGPPAVAQSASARQLGAGRVSTTHPPARQYSPAPQLVSVAQAATHWPAAQTGWLEAQSFAELHVPAAGVARQVSFTHVKPEAQVVPAPHDARHWPFTQTLSLEHSLV